MALFATQEEKELKKKEKEEKEFNKLIEKYHLDSIDKEDFDLIKDICKDLTGTSLCEFGVALDFGTKAEDRIKISRLSAIQDQNWIIINQLGRLNKNIKELIEINKQK